MLEAQRSRRGKGERAVSRMTARYLDPACSKRVPTCASPTGRRALRARGGGRPPWPHCVELGLLRTVQCVSHHVSLSSCSVFLLPHALWGKKQGLSCPSCPLSLRRGSDPFTSNSHAPLRRWLRTTGSDTWSREPGPMAVLLCPFKHLPALGKQEP